ncbi:MAG: 50S ribosomal protein L3 [Gammaproteobacteria bacterium]|nr:50S ribosomal protein L3 [Gammaproteobacteria bacterium]
MALGLVGKKSGMTRIFTEDGVSIPVTVVEVAPNRVTQLKSIEVDGYCAIQVTTGTKRASRVNKAKAGHFSKAGVEAGAGLWEFRVEADAIAELQLGSEFNVDVFENGQTVDVTGRSIGKGFQGGIKRHNFSMQDATHGNSLSHRSNGSIGMNQTPGRVFKGKKMSGHMGDRQRTAQNLEVVRVDVDRGLLLIKGAVPGAKGGDVIIKPAAKA